MKDNNKPIKRIINRIIVSFSFIIYIIWSILIKQLIMVQLHRAFSNVNAISFRNIRNKNINIRKTLSLSSLSRSSTSFDLSSILSDIKLSPKVKQIHLCVLVHGFMGTPLEMGYIKESMLNKIKKEEEKINKYTQLIVHNAISNDGKTTDGIQAGGNRLANEVNTIIDHIVKQYNKMNDKSQSVNISLSFIGNSLGGLYARYALSEINNTNNIQYNTFMTTATPHLGCTGWTYLRIPTMAEKLVGKILQPTGEDLFFECNENNGADNKNVSNLVLVERLSIEDKFVQPLSLFKKRIAYANAYGTDFQVPTNTAAFLSNSNSIHKVIDNHTEENDDDNNGTETPGKPKILLTVETPKQENNIKNNNDSNYNNEVRDVIADRIALRLDALGWTKVFVDLRPTLLEIPMFKGNDVSAPTFTMQKRSSSTKYNTFKASELRSLFGNKLVNQSKLPIPFGHTMMIANSKSPLYAKLNAGGRPLVDKMTSQMYDDIVSISP